MADAHHLAGVERRGVHLVTRKTLLHGALRLDEVAWEYSKDGLAGVAMPGLEGELSGCYADRPNPLAECRASVGLSTSTTIPKGMVFVSDELWKTRRE